MYILKKEGYDITHNKDATRWFSEQQELAIARAIDGRRTPNSGATKFFKGDVVTKRWMIEAKTQIEEKKTFSIKSEWLEKAREEAFSMKKDFMALAFNFGGENQTENYYVISERDFKRLKEYDERSVY